MFCKNCGKELPDGAKFCSSCGTPVAAAGAPEIPPINLEAPVIEFMAPKEAPETGDAAPQGAPAEETPAVEEAPVEEEAQAGPPAEEAAPAGEPQAEEGSMEGTAPAVEAPAAGEEAASAAQGAPQAAPAAEGLPQFDAPSAGAGPGNGPEQPPIKRRGKGALVVIGVIAVAAVAAVVLLVRLVMGLVGSGGKASYVYLNDDYELMYLADLNEKTQALELTDEGSYSSGVCFSPDGKTLYFTDTDETLYKIAVAELKKGGRPERVAREVSSFFLLDDGRLLYTQYDDDSNKLNLYDGEENFRLIRDYYDYQIGSDQKTLYYTEWDETDDTITLYKMAMAKDAKGEKLLKGAASIYTAYDASVLVYGEEDGTDSSGSSAAPDGSYTDHNTLTVYSCKPGDKAEKLVSDVYSVRDVTVDGGKVSFYYLVENVEQHTLYDFVSDASLEEDAALVSEGEPDYPYWYDYYPDELYLDGGRVYYSDRQGNSYPVDTTQLQQETGLPVEELPYWDVHDIAYADAEARYDQDAAEYSEKYDAWYAAWNREGIREDLKATSYNQSSFSVYLYDGGAAKDPVATQVDGLRSTAASGVLLYTKVATIDSGKVADVADLDYYGEIYDYLNSGEENGWYQNVGGKESALEFEEEDTQIWSIYALSDKELVFYIYDGYDYSLQACSIGKDALTFTTTIVEGDDFTVGGTDGGVLYLFTDTDDDGDWGVGDFCTYSNGKLETLVKEVYGALILEDGTMYVSTDMDSRRGSELALLKDGKLTTISDEISGGIFLDGKQVLYISDDDLYLWDGKESQRVARDVERVWASTEVGDGTYYHP